LDGKENESVIDLQQSTDQRLIKPKEEVGRGRSYLLCLLIFFGFDRVTKLGELIRAVMLFV